MCVLSEQPISFILAALELIHDAAKSRMAPVLDLDPRRTAAAIYLSRCFETSPSSPIRQACGKGPGRSRPARRCQWMPSTRRPAAGPTWSCASTAAACGYRRRREPAVESIEFDLGIVLARVQPVEVGAPSTEQHRLAIEHERCIPVSQRRLDDSRITVGPVMAVAGEQPHTLAVALHDQPVAVVFDLVDPFRPVGNLCRLGRNARFNCKFWHPFQNYQQRIPAKLYTEARLERWVRLIPRQSGDEADLGQAFSFFSACVLQRSFRVLG